MGIANLLTAGAGVLGLYGNASTKAAESDANRKALKQLDQGYGQYSAGMADLINNQKSAYDTTYAGIADQLRNADFESAGNIDFNKDNYNVENYYDPRRSQLLQSAANTAQGTAAMNGMGRSLAASQGIATAVADTDANLYKDALSQMNSDRTFDYGVARDSASNRLQALKAKLEAEKSAADINWQGQSDMYANTANLLKAGLDVNTAKAGYANGSDNRSVVQKLMDPAGIFG